MKNYFKILTTILALMAVFLMPEMGWGQSTTTYTFSSKAWAASPANWTSGKDGNQFTSGRGVQVTTGASGANATSPISFTNVSQVVVTYSTNASNGAGSVSIQIGSNTAVSQNVTTTGGTTDRTLTYNYSPSQTGNVKLSVTCTTNSIYVKSVVITTSSGDTPTSHTVTFNPGNGTCATTSLTGSTINLPTATPSATCATAGWAFAGWATASVGETTTAPTLLTGSYLPTSDLTLYAVYSITEGDGGTSTFNFADIASANGWENGVAYTSVTIPPITITAAGGGNNGKWYTSGGGSWRMYSGGTVNISGSGIAVTAVTSSPSCSFAISSGSASFSPTARTDFTNITVTYGSSTTSYATSPTCTALTATTTTIDDSGITNTDVYTSTSAGSLSATVKENVNNTTISGATVTWSSSDTDVATIDASGNVTLVSAGTTIITASYAGNTTYGASSATYTLTVTDSSPNCGTDFLDRAFTGISSGAGYSNWSGKSGSESDAVYAGNSAGGNSSIQIRSDYNNSGIVTTTSGGRVTKVEVVWNINTSNDRVLQIYGKNSPYEAATDLYDNEKQGTLLGTIKYGTSTILNISGDYTYVGLRSASGAMYLTSVSITWACADVCPVPEKPVISPVSGTFNSSQTVSISAGTGETIYYTTDGSKPTTESTEYTGQFTVYSTTVVRAIAVNDCGNSSAVASTKYIFNDGCSTGEYELVDANLTDWSGEYVIAYVANDKATVLKGLLSGADFGDYTDPAIDIYSNTLSEADVDDYKITVVKTGTHYLLLQGTYYIGSTGTPGKLSFSETETGNYYQWDISYNTDHIDIINVATPTIKIKWNDAAPRFACYSLNGSEKNIQIFKKDVLMVPTFSLPAGSYVGEQTVSISSIDASASIYYTTNGQEPTDAHTLYSGPITISETTTLKAVVVKAGCYSDVAEVTYTIIDPICMTGDYKKVTEAPIDWSGRYLIVYETGNVAFDGSLASGDLDKPSNTINVTITNNVITSTATTDASSFVIAKKDDGGYSVQTASGVYIGKATNDNGLDKSETPLYNEISLDGSGNAVIQGAGGPQLQFNDDSGQKRFRYYKNAGQKPIHLYKKTPATEVTVTAVAGTGITEVWINSETAADTVSLDEAVCNDVTFHATVSAGAYFMGWFDEDMNLVSSDLNFTFTVMEEVTYTAMASLTPLLWTTAVNERPATFPTDEVIEAGGSDYVIPLTCEEDLAWFISYVNGFNGQDEHNYAKAKLCADVDMNQYVWVPIGYKTTKEFKGYFDGQCYSIDGLHIASAEEHEYVEAAHGNLMRLGMFGYTDGIDVVSEEQNAVIKNTFVTSGKFYCKSGIATATTYIGSVVGSANETTLEFCEGAAEIEANNGVSVGSVAGSVIHDSYIKACMGMSTIRTSATNTGGITGALSDVSLGDNNKSYLEHGFANSNITALSTASYKWGALVGQFYGGGYADPVYVHPDASGPANMMGDRPNVAQSVIDQEARSYAPYNNSSMLYQLVKRIGTDIQISPRATYTQVTPVTYTSRTTGNEVTVGSTTQALCDELNSRTFHDGTTLQSLGLHWGRVYGITAINGDYPIIYPQNKVNGRVMAVAQRTGEKALRYGSVDDLIKQCNKNADGGTIYMYQTDTIRVSTNANVVVYVHDTVALMQEAATVNAVVGIVMDNSEGNGAEDRDWHFFSPSISGGKTGIIYGTQTCAYPTTTQNDLTYGEGNSYYVKDNDANVYFPNGIGAATNPDKQFDLYSYYEPEYHWINLKRIHANHWHQDEINGQHPQITYNETDNDANGEFKPGKGYMMAIGNDDDYDNTLLQAKGVLNNDVVSATVTSRGAHLKGYNLIGNPYQSYLDFNAFANLAGNASALWTGGGQGYKAYLVYDAAIDGFRQYLADESGESYSLGAENVAGRYINMHQGFFVVKNTTTESATVKFNNSMRVTDQYFNFRSEQPTYPLVNLFCSDENGKHETVIMEFERPLNAGALKMRGILNGKGQVYIHWNNDDLGSVFIDHMPDYVPVWFEAAEDGVFTMTWNTANANFGYMHLIDNIAGADIDMLENDSYTFESHVTDMKARFRLVFKPLGIEEETTEQGENFAFINGEVLVVNGTGELSFIDLNGRVLATQYMAGEQNFMALPNVAEGMYLLRLAGTNGVKVQKIIIRR